MIEQILRFSVLPWWMVVSSKKSSLKTFSSLQVRSPVDWSGPGLPEGRKALEQFMNSHGGTKRYTVVPGRVRGRRFEKSAWGTDATERETE